MEQRHSYDDHEPTLKQVDQCRRHFKLAHGKALEDDSGDGQRPLDAEDRPTHRPMQRDERERCIGARDQQVDGGVVKHMKDMPRPRPHQRVVERGAKVDEHQVQLTTTHIVPRVEAAIR